MRAGSTGWHAHVVLFCHVCASTQAKCQACLQGQKQFAVPVPGIVAVIVLRAHH